METLVFPQRKAPGWLYPAQGLGMGLFIIGLVLFKVHGWATVALGASGVVFCVLPVLQSARSRVILDVYTSGQTSGFPDAYKLARWIGAPH
jgi:hypothetical protein